MQINSVIIDDSEGDRYLARRALSDSGIVKNILEFEDGDDALHFFQNVDEYESVCGPNPPPTLVLMDINMPGKDGFELLEDLKNSSFVEKLNDKSACIILLFTSSNNDRDRERVEQYNTVKGYLIKPLDEEKLQSILKQHYQKYDLKVA